MLMRIRPKLNIDPERYAKAESEKPTPASERVTVDQAAQIFGVSVRTIRRWQKAKNMPPRFRRRRAHYYLMEDIKAMLPDDDRP